MTILIRIVVAFIAAAAGLIIIVKLGGLERRAKADTARVLALPSVSFHASGMSGRGAGFHENGWIVMPFAAPGTPVTEEDIEALPEPARRYFRYAKVLGKPRISSFAVVLEGRIRNGPGKPWMPLTMRQFNRLDNPARVVLLTSTKPPINGIDSYLDGQGRMLIKAVNTIKIVDDRSPEMSVSALVTFLNDLVLCPLGYFSLPLRLRQAGPDSVELAMTHAGMAVSAVMTMDADGRPVDWRTDDRYAGVNGRNIKDRWSTPFQGSREAAGLRIPEKGSGIHCYDGNPYIYVELDRIHSLTLDANGLPPRPGT